MRLNFMNRHNEILTEIYVDPSSESVRIINHTNNLLDRAFGCNEHPTIKDFESFIERRSIPQNRAGFEDLMEFYGIKDTTPLGIVRHFSGRTADDEKWIDFIED